MLSWRPHDGHTDQVRQLTLAAALAVKLRRTLVLPPLMHHLDSPSCLPASAAAPGWRRPRMSSLFNLTSLGVPYVERSHANETGCRISSAGAQHESCVVVDASWLSLDRLSGSSGAARAARHLHFSSLLFEPRGSSPSPSCRFASWERLLAQGPCSIQYRKDILARALSVLQRLMGTPSFVAVHVRALPEAAAKRDPAREWTARLFNLLRDELRGGPLRVERELVKRNLRTRASRPYTCACARACACACPCACVCACACACACECACACACACAYA